MSPLRGIGLKLCAVCLFVIMNALLKACMDRISSGQAVFFRSFFALPVLVVWLALRHDLKNGFKVKSPFSHFCRGTIGTVAMALAFAALGLLPLAEVTAISYAMPIFIVIFAAIFLGENIRAFRMAMITLGMAGVLIVLWPRFSFGQDGSGYQTLGAILMLGSAFMAAIAQVFIRNMVKTESVSAIVFWFTTTATLLSLTTIPFGWTMPQGWEWVMLISAGLAGGMAQIFLTSSYRYGDASLIASFEYASMVFALAIAWVFFDEIPTLTVLIGAGLIISAGLLIIWRERQLGIKRKNQDLQKST